MTGSSVADASPRVLVISGQASLSREDVGSSKRQWHLITGLRQNGMSATVWSINADSAMPLHEARPDEIRASRRLAGRTRRGTAEKLRSLISPMPEEVWMRPVRAAPWLSEVAEHDVVLLMGPAPAQMLPWARAATRPVVVDMHDVPHDLVDRIARTLPRRVARWRTWVDARKWARLERRVTAASNLVTAVSEEDAEAFRAMSRTPVVVRPNGVDIGGYAFVDHRVAGPGRLLMTGDFAYLPNIDAARWLMNEIMPKLRAVRPAVTLSLVGRLAPAEPWPDGVIAAADVPQIQPWFDDADVFIVPLRAGGGTRIKIIEAFAKGVPCVATAVACEGLPVRDGEHLLIANSTHDLVGATLRLLDEADLRARLATNGRRLVEQQFDWAAITDAFAADLRTVAHRAS